MREEGEEKKKEDMAKVNIDPKDLEFHLDLQLLCYIEGASSVQHCRVHITDAVGTVLEAAQKLHGSTLLPIYQGRRLNPYKTFWEE